jgi:transglycosylase-like protein with SLT domain/peptidase M23-like protein
MNRRIVVIGIALACAVFAVAVLPVHADDCVETPGVTTPVATVPSVSVCPQVPTVSVPQVNVPTPAPAPAPAPTPQPSQPQPSQPQPQQQQQSSQPQQSSPSKSSSKPQATSEGSRQQTTNGPKVTQTVTGKPESEPKSTGSSGGGGGGHAKPSAPNAPAPDQPVDRTPGGAPTAANPTVSFATPGPAQVGVPNFFIDKFRIPPFLLPIYQAAGIQYNIPWQILAAINEIETDYGRNLSVSTAGALGWMQFMPSSWRTYGVDANNDGRKDPYNPVDAIFAAARYLKAADGDKDIRKAIFAYNHATWYVDSVMLRAKLIGGLPAGLVGSLTGLTQGHFPVHARARYADDAAEKASSARYHPDSATQVVDSNANRRSINIYARQGAPVVAVQDGQIKQMGESRRLGKYLVLQDAYGNQYTYAHLGSLQTDYPAPKPAAQAKQAKAEEEIKAPQDPSPTEAASSGSQRQPKPKPTTKSAAAKKGGAAKKGAGAAQPTADSRRTPAHGAAPAPGPIAVPSVSVEKERLYAHPARKGAMKGGGKEQLFQAGDLPGFTTFKSYFTQVFGLNRKDVVLRPMRRGARVIAGTILGRIGAEGQASPHVQFAIRPAGKGAPRIDPKPILDGWKLLESTAIYRAAGKNPFFGSDGQTATIGQILLMSKEQLQGRVLDDPRVQIYDCGRKDIEGGQIDRRVLATLEFLANSGLKPTVTALKCGHSYLTTSGNVSEHSSGDAVDIGAINGIPIVGHQGKGSITDITIQRLLTLQGTMKPHQIISLMTPADFGGADNILSLPDHYNHIHVGFHPMYNSSDGQGALKAGQWIKLIDRLNNIDNPTVPVKPSKDAIPVKPGDHAGD